MCLLASEWCEVCVCVCSAALVQVLERSLLEPLVCGQALQQVCTGMLPATLTHTICTGGHASCVICVAEVGS